MINEQEIAMTTARLATADAVEWTEVLVSEIRQAPGDDLAHRKHIVILTERDGERRLPMWIGPAEAVALALTLESEQTPRPFTYKLAADLVAAAGASIAEVRITHLQAPIFYASVLVRGAAGVHEVDSRPSDAMNLALATGAPIRINPELLDQIPPDQFDEELAQFSVATADLVAEARQRMEASPRDACDH